MLRTIAAFDRIGEENAFAVLARATQLAAQGRDIINLGIGQPDFRTPDFIVEAAVKALRDGHHGYTPAVGILPLREAVAADLHKRFKVEVAPDAVMIFPGGKPTMFMSIMMFGEPGAEILYPDPGFPDLSLDDRVHRRAARCRCRSARRTISPSRRRKRCSLITPQTRLLIVNSPANPTGGVTPKAEVDKLVAGLERYPDVAVMSDEIYDHMLYDGEAHVCLLQYPSIRDRLILLNGWSKTYAMTGWRLGYAVWPGKLYDFARKLAVNLHSCVNAPTQYAGLAALTGPQDEVATMVAEFDKRRKVVVEGLNRLPGMSCATPEGRVLRVSRTSSAPAGRQSRSPARCWKTPASPSSAGRISACSAKVMCACPTPTRRRTFCARSTASAIFWRAARRRSASAHPAKRAGIQTARQSLGPRFREPRGMRLHHPFCVSWKPTTTTTRPDELRDASAPRRARETRPTA